LSFVALFYQLKQITMATKNILLVGIDPKLIDFSSPEFAAFPGLTAEKVNAGIQHALSELKEQGYEADLCHTDFGQTAISVVKEHLKAKTYDGVLVGAGVRVPEKNFLLFEEIVNVIHEHAPSAKLMFNTNPKDTLQSVKRRL
jgi:hypothetical protein